MKLKSQFFDVSDKKSGYYNSNNVYVGSTGSGNYNKSKKSKMLDYKNLISSNNSSSNYYKNTPNTTKSANSNKLDFTIKDKEKKSKE